MQSALTMGQRILIMLSLQPISALRHASSMTLATCVQFDNALSYHSFKDVNIES